MEILLQGDSEVDNDMVESLIKGARLGMRAATVEDITNPSELLTAVATLLDQSMRSVRQLQSPTERFHNAKIFAKVLNDLMADHGRVPS